MKLIKKILQRYREFKEHPVTSSFPLGALYRYIHFNIKNLFVKECHYNWINGLQFIARKGDAGIVSNIYHGLYEFEDSIFLLHYVTADDVFFDIGANLGHYSLILSGSKKCTTYAFEPVPETYQQLEKQVKINHLENLISLHNLGFADQIGTLHFSTNKGVMNRIVAKNEKNSIEVPVTTIDYFCQTIQPTVLKIDVEGFEKFVVNGGLRTLKSKSLKVVLIEFNGFGEKYGVTDLEVYETLLDCGFLPYIYSYQNKKLHLQEHYNIKKFNTILIKDLNFAHKRLNSDLRVKIVSNWY